MNSPIVPGFHHEIEYHSDRFTKLVLSVCASLIAAGVMALWSMSTHVAQLEERMAGWTRSMTEQITQVQTASAGQTKILEIWSGRLREIENQHTRDSNRIEDILRRIENLERTKH